jgi:hypothetical protein
VHRSPSFVKLVFSLQSIIDLLDFLRPADPVGAFDLIAHALLKGGARHGYQFESLAINRFVAIVGVYLADHRGIFERARRFIIRFKTMLADGIAATFANVWLEDADLLVGAIERLRRYGPAGSVQLKRRTFERLRSAGSNSLSISSREVCEPARRCLHKDRFELVVPTSEDRKADCDKDNTK